MHNYSDYIIYVDESGDHSLTSIDEGYPIFVLAFCIFKKDSYSKNAVQKLKHLKFKYFGHDMIVLHENEIRKDKGDFVSLRPKEKKDKFIGELASIIEEEDFCIITTVINKKDLQSHPHSPYDLALKYCMEKTYQFLESQNQHEKIIHIVVEQRGKKEDAELELEFRRIRDGKNQQGISYPFEIIMANKQSNSAGLQLADLVARPIGLSIFKPEQKNMAFDIIKKKLYKNGEGKIDDIQFKVFS